MMCWRVLVFWFTLGVGIGTLSVGNVWGLLAMAVAVLLGCRYVD